MAIAIEVYQWSSAEFPREHAVVYTSVNDKSKFSIFRTSVNPEKVLVRLADSFCDDHPIRVNVELIAERDNNGYFNYRVVRLVEAGFSDSRSSIHYDKVNLVSKFWETRLCSFTVGPGINKKIWGVRHEYPFGLRKDTGFYVEITCHKEKGLSAQHRGPFKSLHPETLLGIRREIYGEPPTSINEFVESEFIGNEYMLFQGEGRGNSATEASARVTVNNTAAQFQGNGNGSRYQNCYVVMNHKASKATN